MTLLFLISSFILFIGLLAASAYCAAKDADR